MKQQCKLPSLSTTGFASTYSHAATACNSVNLILTTIFKVSSFVNQGATQRKGTASSSAVLVELPTSNVREGNKLQDFML